jgi:hypothetical protein
MGNSSVERPWTVSDCKWMCVEGGLCVILSFEQFKIFPTHSSVLVRNSWVGVHCLCVRTDSKPRMSVHWHPTFISRMNRAHIAFIPLTITYKTCLYVERSRSVHVWTRSVSDSCVGYSWNTAPYLLVCVNVHIMSVIVSNTCVIRQWIIPPTLRKIGQFLDAQARTIPICAWFVSDSCVIGCVTGPLIDKIMFNIIWRISWKKKRILHDAN